MRTDELGPRTVCRCTAYAGALGTLNAQESKPSLAGDSRHILPNLLALQTNYQQVLHFPSGESVLIDLDTFLALSPSSPVYSSLAKKGRKGGRDGREEGKKKNE